MRIVFLFFFCSIMSVSASAQWWKLKFKKEPPRVLEPMALTAAPQLPKDLSSLKIRTPHLRPHKLSMSDLALESAQSMMMKAAQRNMRYRVYGQASYNFSELAQLYVKQGRYSEAKWYFLQSINLSRKQNDHQLTLSNLMRLAMVKLEIGDYALAYKDLIEARDLASSKGWLIDLIEVEKKLLYLQRSRVAALRVNRYADDAVSEN